MARQGIKARHQGKMARQDGKARHAIIGIIIGKASAIGRSRHRQGIGNCHRHRHAIGIGKSGRRKQDAERSKVAQYSHTDIERVLRCAVMKIFE